MTKKYAYNFIARNHTFFKTTLRRPADFFFNVDLDFRFRLRLFAPEDELDDVDSDDDVSELIVDDEESDAADENSSEEVDFARRFFVGFFFFFLLFVFFTIVVSVFDNCFWVAIEGSSP